MALQTFAHQYKENEVYRQYCQHLGITQTESITNSLQIPFLPVSFFKTHAVKSFRAEPSIIFKSSATGGMGQSEHALLTMHYYETSFMRSFEATFGSVKNKCILGLLPSYLEREGSSLIYMVQHLMQQSGHALNGFFLFEHQILLERLIHLEQKKESYFLFGVSFALLDFAQKHALPLNHAIIIETGGMKGRKKEITRAELMAALKNAFGTSQIYSEYGMTELLSQAYANIGGLYHCSPWMQIRISDLNDPFTFLIPGKTGIINVIDLANQESCAFIQTADLGKLNERGEFEVLGRADHSDIRGCALMIEAI